MPSFMRSRKRPPPPAKLEINRSTEVSVQIERDEEGRRRLEHLFALLDIPRDSMPGPDEEVSDVSIFTGVYAPTSAFWCDGRTEIRVYVNDIDVTANPEPGSFPSGPSVRPPSRSQTLQPRLRRREKIVNLMLDSAQHLNTFIEKTHEKFSFTHVPADEDTTPVEHNPRIVYHPPRIYGGGLNCAIPMMDQRRIRPSPPSLSLREIGENAVNRVSSYFARPRDERDMTPLLEQRPAVPDMEANLTSDQVSEIHKWAEDTISESNPLSPQNDGIHSLTTRELLSLEGGRIDKIELAKHYCGPPNTPLVGATDADAMSDVPGLSLDANEDTEQNLNETQIAKRKDLLNYLGEACHVSIHLAADNINSFEADLNLSDYYKIHLIEPRNTKKVTVGNLEDPVVKQSLSSDETDNTAVERVEIRSLNLGDLEVNEDKDENQIVAAPSYRPVQALVLYLCGKGKSHDCIATMLIDLDDEFKNLKGKVFRGIKFPEQFDWSDDWVAKVVTLCKTKPKHHIWENLVKKAWEKKIHGSAYKLAKKNAKIAKMREIVHRTLEDHFDWRFGKGENENEHTNTNGPSETD
ncbi:uncharacterized protein LY89DRAFT_219689 [Mollisia scopiformis]|uniref:Uncharacterized protein n=1 Tax=Mollisia scopiformis TaxID=149040 RepID=A0A194WVP3_MOLSC|nr:uncharacterized protein LY89DRAFT_219689 [Mollisia scopiformis]KUJ12038.1 hypothetical protein LY89DRAFT_219689 [Mollisia scopiformis]